jgi:hypothetical protein
VRKDVAKLLNSKNWRRSDWRKKMGEAMAGERTEEPLEGGRK